MKALIAATLLSVMLGGDTPPSSRIILHQTGTIPNHEMKRAASDFEAYGCQRIGVFRVDDENVNVYCLDMMVAE